MDIVKEIKQTEIEAESALSTFNNCIDSNIIDLAIHKFNAAKNKLSILRKMAKEEGVSSDSITSIR